MAKKEIFLDDCDWYDEYLKKEKWLSECYERVTPKEFYADLFSRQPISKKGERESGKGNPVIQFFLGKKEYPNPVDLGRHRDMFLMSLQNSGIKSTKWQVALNSDLEELKYTDIETDQLCAISHCSFYGCRRLNKYANYLYALTLDIDYVTAYNLERTISVLENDHWSFTMPTYLVNSGKGLHFVYVLEEPIWIYPPHRQKMLSKLKYNMAVYIWKTLETSLKQDNVDAQDCTHTYRVVGSKTKKGWLTTAYKVGKVTTKADIDKILHACNPPAKDLQFHWEDLDYKSKSGLTLEECKTAFPDWYARVIEKKPVKRTETPVGKFPWLYENYKERFMENVAVGHRYHGLCILFADAYKCGVSLEDAKAFALSQLNEFNSLEGAKDDPFTEEDINCASLYWNYKSQSWFTLDLINKWSGINFERARRNGRKQAVHCKMMTAMRKVGIETETVKDTRFGAENGNPRGKGGRKSAEAIVRTYLKQHPDAKKAEVIRETGLSKPTVLKWYKEIKG